MTAVDCAPKNAHYHDGKLCCRDTSEGRIHGKFLPFSHIDRPGAKPTEACDLTGRERFSGDPVYQTVRYQCRNGIGVTLLVDEGSSTGFDAELKKLRAEGILNGSPVKGLKLNPVTPPQPRPKPEWLIQTQTNGHSGLPSEVRKDLDLRVLGSLPRLRELAGVGFGKKTRAGLGD